MSHLQDQIAIVTGAGRGVGREVSLMLARKGCKVAAVSRTQSDLDSLAAKIQEEGGTVLTIAADVSQTQAVEQMVEQVVQAFGKIDILINNAGVGKYGTIEELSVEDYDAMMNTNMRSTFLCTKFVYPHMKKQQKGHILNVSSVAGLKGLPHESVYCASKFAQVGFAQALDHEARLHGIKVSSVCPGGINTTFAFGTGRTPGDPKFETFSSAEEVAEVVLFVLQQPEKSRIIEVFMRPMVEPL